MVRTMVRVPAKEADPKPRTARLYPPFPTAIIVFFILLSIKGFSMRWQHMLRHRRAHDDGSPCCSRKPLPKDEAGGLEYSGIVGMRRAYSRIHSRDIPCHTRRIPPSDNSGQTVGYERQVEVPVSAAIFAPILQERWADRPCPGE